MTKVRAGVIGLNMGRHHVIGYQEHPQCDVVAVCDVDEQRLQKIGAKYDVPALYTSVDAMLTEAKLDVVSIATPNRLHKSLTLLALEHGCHVLCEKPMAMNSGEAVEMLEAAKAADRRLMINYSWRFTDASWALKRFVDDGGLGDVYFARTIWHRRRGFPPFGNFSSGQKASQGGGPLVDLGVHRLDLALWFMGFPKPAWVLGGAYDKLGREIAAREGWTLDVEDLAAGFVRFENGATLVVEASWAANLAEKELMETRLLGTKAGIVQRNLNEDYEFEAEIFYESGGTQYDVKPHKGMSVTAPSGMFHFVESILNDRPHLATGEEGLVTMQILDAIYKSDETGAPVQL